MFSPKVTDDNKLWMEVVTALREKASAFLPRSLPYVARILEAQHAKRPIEGGSTVELSNLQSDSFELAMRQLEYDQKVYRVWQGKMRNYDSATPPLECQRACQTDKLW